MRELTEPAWSRGPHSRRPVGSRTGAQWGRCPLPAGSRMGAQWVAVHCPEPLADEVSDVPRVGHSGPGQVPGLGAHGPLVHPSHAGALLRACSVTARCCRWLSPGPGPPRRRPPHPTPGCCRARRPRVDAQLLRVAPPPAASSTDKQQDHGPRDDGAEEDGHSGACARTSRCPRTNDGAVPGHTWTLMMDMVDSGGSEVCDDGGDVVHPGSRYRTRKLS